MNRVAPEGDVYQAGTLSGNPLAMAAGIATLRKLQEEGFYARLQQSADLLLEKVENLFADHAVACKINRSGSLFSLFFTGREVHDYESVLSCDTDIYARFYRGLLEAGVYFPPSQYEVCFLSGAHCADDINKTAEAVDRAITAIQQDI
jgi:Glutamate-1-semialdehyde aminotransferase